MSYDGLVTGAIARQLHGLLAGGRIEKIYQPDKDELLLHVQKDRQRYRLLISANGNHARMHLSEGESGNPQTPPAFCMLLRKHFQGGRITEIRQVDSERIIHLSVDHADELGFTVSKRLIVEIMGKHSNIIALDVASGQILDSIKRIGGDINRFRQLLPGLPYLPPPDQGKISLYTLTETTLQSLLDKTIGEESLARILADHIQGLSPVFAEEVCKKAAADLSKDGAVPIATSLFQVLQEIASAINESRTTPVVYVDKDRVPVDFHVFPLHALTGHYDVLHFSGAGEAADYFYTHKASSNRIRQKTGDLNRHLKGLLDKLYLKKQRLSEELLKAENSHDDRMFGELLTAHLHEIPKGVEKASVFNYYDETIIDIPLDHRYSASQNAQKYFKKYAKAKTAVREKNLQLVETEESIRYLESIFTYAENAESAEEVEALRNELIESGYLARRKSTGKPVKPKLSPHSFQSSDGFRIVAGKNNKENDYLTFKTADKRDVWFHTKDIPGSHVILFTEGKPATETAILEASSLAAYYSKARNSWNVPVDYTEVRYVKKPVGAKPGMVIFTNNRTVFAQPKLL